ncbi:uncharacterized protein LOC118204722 [Stegodyphus dumicola]|uniref:uncharacterized protein LOC118204722 n=1 Tax=Stegodyphus dumicola TaxID=202533 RepID=UPI0015AA97B4|nr:uncharacterized protein LOC118204722 [Stegodyphus dumicola]
MSEGDESKQAETNGTSATFAKISIKIPSFWKPDPKIWFLQAEAQFRNAGITADQTKYDYVVSSIETVTLSQISDILTKPPDNGKYPAIKKRLIEIFADSETQKTRKLMTELELGDKKPSQLLCEMRNLAAEKVPDEFLKTLWMQRLSLDTRSILSVSSDDLSKLSTMADKIWELNPNPSQVARIVFSPFDNITSEDLQKQISNLTLQIAEMNTLRNSSPQRRRYRSNSRNRFKNNNDPNNCYFHQRFGERAYKCTPPCKYQISKQEN